jgi:hypothetical protein
VKTNLRGRYVRIGGGREVLGHNGKQHRCKAVIACRSMPTSSLLRGRSTTQATGRIVSTGRASRHGGGNHRNQPPRKNHVERVLEEYQYPAACRIRER